MSDEIPSDSLEDARPEPRRAVYLLPAMLTLGSIFLGFFAIVKAIGESFGVAALCLVFAGVLDKFDGLVARKTGTDSDFGRELDSLADVVSFGVAPAVLAFTWALDLIPKLGWAAAFFYLTCGSLRLARYNVQVGSTDRRWFVGLPIPIAAGVPVTIVLAWSDWQPPIAPPVWVAWCLLVLMLCVSFLMVSKVRYFALKDVGLARGQRHVMWISLAGVLVALAAWPTIVLLIAVATYVSSGLVLRFLSWRKSHRDDDGTEALAPAIAGEPDAERPA